jgi:hypothetical protein
MSNTVYCLQCFILILLSGLRNQVGGDTFAYMREWNIYPVLSELSKADFLQSRYEALWVILNSFIKTLGGNFTTLQIFHAVFVNISIFIIINKYSDFRFSTVLAFFCMAFCYWNMEILRESIAVCIFLFAIPSLINNKWRRYYLLITVAFFFHSGAIILYFIPFIQSFLRKNFTIKTILLVLVAILFILSIQKYLATFLNRQTSHYFDLAFNLTGLTVGIIKIIFLYLLIHIRQHYRINHTVIDIGLKFYFILTVYTLFSPVIGARWSNYFIIFFYISFIDLFWLFKGKAIMAKSMIVCFFLILTVNYYYRDISDWTRLKGTVHFGELFYPYYSVFEEVPQQVLYRRTAIAEQENTKN